MKINIKNLMMWEKAAQRSDTFLVTEMIRGAFDQLRNRGHIDHILLNTLVDMGIVERDKISEGETPTAPEVTTELRIPPTHRGFEITQEYRDQGDDDCKCHEWTVDSCHDPVPEPDISGTLPEELFNLSRRVEVTFSDEEESETIYMPKIGEEKNIVKPFDFMRDGTE